MNEPVGYVALMFCEHCRVETRHLVSTPQHDPDGTGGYRQCLVCGWFKVGNKPYEPGATIASAHTGPSGQ